MKDQVTPPLRLASAQRVAEFGAPSPAFVIVDNHCRIKYVSPAGDPNDSELKWIIISRAKVRPDVETFIRGLSLHTDSRSSPVQLTQLQDDRVLRAVRVVGSDGVMFVLSVEIDHNCNSLQRAARRHQLTRRETEVLSLILDGCNAGEIAQALMLSEHTVQGYFKRLLFKTGARNRISMVASLFDWNPRMREVAPIARPAHEPGRVSLASATLRNAVVWGGV